MKEKEEESSCSAIMDGFITGIQFALASRDEISKSSNSDCPISHASQLSNPFLGLPLESGKCESCGTAEVGECEGHFGYIELPTPIYHPSHVTELKKLLSLLCLKCLKVKNKKNQTKNVGVAERVLSSCCEEASQVSISEEKTSDGACYLQLKLPSRSHPPNGFWHFLERYGFRYGDDHCRPLLPAEVMVILRKIPQESKKKLIGKGFFAQEGYILQHLPVPPNCLSVPDVSDGSSVMSSDHSISVLKKVLRQADVIKSTRSGIQNFESTEVEANDLQVAVSQYLEVRGTAKASRDVDGRFGIKKEGNSSTKVWLEKMRTLFIRKGSGFSSRSIITGDPYKDVGEIGLPFEIAQRITFEEKVNQHNMMYLQKLVDQKLCLAYKDGSTTYSLREGSKGHTFLRPGQVVHRRIMDGDIVFINRPPTTHKHSLQALKVYIHDDHTVKINPLICAPLSADFDGDAIHLFYPQSLAAKAEVLELFSVEKQLLSSHSGNLNLQLATDSVLSLKLMFKKYFFGRAATQQLAMFVSGVLPIPALLRAQSSDSLWTVLQLLQISLPPKFDCCGERHNIWQSQILDVDYNRDLMQSIINDVVSSIFFGKGPIEALRFFDSVQPMLMENLYTEGFSVGLEDFYVPKEIIQNCEARIQEYSSILYRMRESHNELIALQLERQIRSLRVPIANQILKSSAIGYLIDSKSESAINKVVQQVGFLGLQISDRGKFYSKTLVADIASLFRTKYPSGASYPSEEYGLVRGCLIHGLDPYQSIVHSISSREVIVRSSRGLTEPGTLFKNLMAILRDVIICYDGTVRNVCSNSIIQFEYGMQTGTLSQSIFAAGEPVGVLAATAMSNPAYKAVLDSSPSSNNSWAMMKEILLCGATFKNDEVDRRVILYLNGCDCGRKHCGENAAYMVKKQLKRISLKDAAVEFLIEYNSQQTDYCSANIDAGLVGHFHLNEDLMKDSNVRIDDVFEKCQDTLHKFSKKKKGRVGILFSRIGLSVSQFCSFRQTPGSKGCDMPCLKFFWKDSTDIHLEKAAHIFSSTICPVLLETIIKGDPRVCSADIIWVSPDTTSWIRNRSSSEKGELAIDVVLDKKSVKQTGDAWRIVLDSCLPVIHLIDTRRSVPYSVKQLQELLGISCAFEQAIQRLSTSVTMVTKGVLREHLILLANSMTYSGNLVGFNKAGIKALSRSLNVQVPFTEATLFTPKKCFETAAEKCHVDSLASIVASCSWGKHVAVGTGSSFDLLWDTREAELKGTDVYDFLSLVNSSSGVEKNSACLGAEIDDLDWAFDYDEEALSPVHASEKPVFEDIIDIENPEGNGWGNGTTEPGSDEVQVSGWNSMSNEEAGDPWGKKVETPQVEVQVSGWDTMSDHHDKISNEESGDPWGSKVEIPQESGWAKKAENGKKKQEVEIKDVWGEKKADKLDSAWSEKASDQAEMSGDIGQLSGWDTNRDGNASSNWNKRDMPSLPDGNRNSVQCNKAERSRSDAWENVGKSQSDAWGNSDGNAGLCKNDKNDTSDWNKDSTKAGSSQKSGSSSPWYTKPDQTDESQWSHKATQPAKQSEWGQKDDESSNWNKGIQVDGTPEPGSWGVKSSSKQQPGDEADHSQWSQKDAQPDMQSQWTQKDDKVDSSNWDKDTQVDETPKPGSWGVKSSSSQQSGSLSPRSMEPNKADDSQWSKKDTQPDRATGLGSSSGWKKKEGWSSSNAAGEGRPKSNRPYKPIGGTNSESVPVPMTATRKRLDLFTAEEQELLTEIEPIMQSIRKIMNQPGYNEGDPLGTEDQAYIVDHVFNYHPDKAAKMGAGIHYVMISKHSSFQDTRCLYIVSTDGRKEDFSYRKCLENYMKEKFPDRGEAFMAKYLKRNQQPRPGWNKERSTPDTSNSAVKNKRKGWGNGWGNEGSVSEAAATENKGGWGDPGSGPGAGTTGGKSGGWGDASSGPEAAAGNKYGGWGGGGSGTEAAATGNKSGGWGDGGSGTEVATGNKSGGWGDTGTGTGAEAATTEHKSVWATANSGAPEEGETVNKPGSWGDGGSGAEAAATGNKSGGWGDGGSGTEAAATGNKSGGWGIPGTGSEAATTEHKSGWATANSGAPEGGETVNKPGSWGDGGSNVTEEAATKKSSGWE
ncbi:DNA-directed RNA polymerase V subunit 1 [Daucus carota subsp. sativus]|uniref:DNA-directed RNA polymerase V subunit 1 n=1 Tax=Daucus carota subsp. sativus TaxID=79200 RepID=UPI0007B2C2E1|nr:PREDICTED: DNA-directed RNA polymerase V subunit 1 [Daucus carota subsp. sativus]